VTLARGVAYVGGRTGAGRRRRKRTDDGRRPAAGGVMGRGGRRASQNRYVTLGRGLRGRTDGRAGTSHPVTERCDGLYLEIDIFFIASM